MNRLALTKVTLSEKNYIAYVLLDEKRKIVDFQLFSDCSQNEELLNTIFIARVEHIVSNIHSAFVKISPTQKCYLSLEDLKSPIFTKKLSNKNVLSMGDELIVQVIKDKIKTKDPVVSSKLTLSGTYCMLTTDNLSLSISKKITGEERQPLQEILSEIESLSKEYAFGIIIRTNATEVSKETVLEDVKQVIDEFIDLKTTGVHKLAYSVLVKEKEAYIRKLKTVDLHTLDGIYTDDSTIYKTIQKELPYLQEHACLHFYEDTKLSLKALYNITGSIEELTKKKVWLKSGANIIIEQLETMTVIDVNSSKNISKNERALCEINKEAAVEIARQLRLRNISGMVIIDFINLSSKKQMQEVVECLKEAIKTDPILTTFVDVTKLGLVEVTRKKTYKSLKETIGV